MSGISWTEQTWNPVVGCSHVSPGCDHCYAERMAKRLVGAGVYPSSVTTPARNENEIRGGWSGEVATFPLRLEEPLHYRKPRMMFVCSMGDLFHEGVPDEFIWSVFSVMADACQHTFQVLTKRPGRARSMLTGISDHPEVGMPWPLPNVWLGVTAENQEQADKRIPILLDTPAALRFVSVEPMLGPVDLTNLTLMPPDPPHGPGVTLDALRGHFKEADDVMRELALSWVICGGETGPGARPMQAPWVQLLRDQCVAAGVPFHFKAWGPTKAAGRLLDGREWLEMP